MKNARKLDAIREKIDELNLDSITKSVALTSLMLALDRVDSTLGHYAAMLIKSPWGRAASLLPTYLVDML